MKLPHADQARVERDKLVGYLLNPAHPFGASKARFFLAFGFRADQWTELAAALCRHAREHDVVEQRETGHGPRYTVEGVLLTPSGRHPRVRAVWQLDKGEIAPRLITAYPASS